MFLTCFFFSLVSCQKSAKGNWSNSDLKSCKLDFRAELENDSESKEILSLIGSTLDEFSGCACKKLEEKFDSYSFANKKTTAAKNKAWNKTARQHYKSERLASELDAYSKEGKAGYKKK